MPAPAPTQGTVEGGPPRTELQELQLKADQTTDEVGVSLDTWYSFDVFRNDWFFQLIHLGNPWYYVSMRFRNVSTLEKISHLPFDNDAIFFFFY